MIPGDLAGATAAPGLGGITIDELFRAAAARRPDALALADAPNRHSGSAPRMLRYAEADRIVSAIAGRLRGMGLPTDAVVGIQLPDTVENILTILGVLRAGMIAAPLPLLWRRADLVTALSRAGAKAIVTCARAGGCAHAELATRVAAEVFSIRYVCGFGTDLPDGVVPLDDLFTAEPEPFAPLDRSQNAAAHLAVVSFEIGDDGVVPVARRHLELLAGGLGIVLESGIDQQARILSTLAPASFAGIALTVVPWLLAGGTLVLHPPFDNDVFLQQWREHDCGTLIVPAPVAFDLAAAGRFKERERTTILAAWRAPEQLATSPAWREDKAALVDVSIFGETAFIAAHRGADGAAVPLPLGAVTAPHDSAGAVTVAELSVTGRGTAALRGPMVPAYAFPPGIEDSDQPHFAIRAGGVVDTGYRCRSEGQTVRIAGPPAGIVIVGGHRLSLRGLQAAIARIDAAATLSAVPDALLGERLVGMAPEPAAMRSALGAIGLNPLAAMAFAEATFEEAAFSDAAPDNDAPMPREAVA